MRVAFALCNRLCYSRVRPCRALLAICRPLAFASRSSSSSKRGEVRKGLCHGHVGPHHPPSKPEHGVAGGQ